MTTWQQRVTSTFIELADTVVDNFDLICFLDTLAKRYVEMLGIDAAVLVLLDQRGEWDTTAISNRESSALNLMRLPLREGPCAECVRTGRPIVCDDTKASRRWPAFARAAQEIGLGSAYALPMRRAAEIIGAVGLYTTRSGPLSAESLAFGQALADVATIGILHERAVRRHKVTAEQLQGALDSRVLIEQAKGMLAERWHVPVADAFAAMRDYARRGGLRLDHIAAAVIGGDDLPEPVADRPRQSR